MDYSNATIKHANFVSYTYKNVLHSKQFQTSGAIAKISYIIQNVRLAMGKSHTLVKLAI